MPCWRAWLQHVQNAWWRSAVEWIDGIALDGKTLRCAARLGAHDAHLLSACSHQLGVVLAQVAMPDTTNEAGAVGALLEALVLEGRTRDHGRSLHPVTVHEPRGVQSSSRGNARSTTPWQVVWATRKRSPVGAAGVLDVGFAAIPVRSAGSAR
jgi:hypothetical protein